MPRDQAESVEAPVRSETGRAWGRWTEEVRLAMAWNGGVSLAVWMGGVAVELDAAQRARRPVADLQADPARTEPAARSTAQLYAAICNAFDRRLVIDILSGASAGGLNGALLAGAIVHDKQLGTGFMREHWLKIGDFGRLLQPLDNQSPTSVMQGNEFLTQVRLAFEELLETTGPPKVNGDRPAVMLDVQATNVSGEQRCFVDDWGESFYASEFRAPIRFRKPADYTAEVLAEAARASASFPGAFEPQELVGHVATLAGLAEKERWAIDGGLLENAPIRPAIELIPLQRASAPVKRYVCYVNAAPTGHADSPPTTPQPDLAKVISYTLNLPRDGRVIDQLRALDDGSRRAGTTADTGVKLLALPAETLRATAQALLSTYQQRRAVLALEELLAGSDGPSGPGLARQLLARLGKDAAAAGAAPGPAAGVAQLPFIPADLDPPQRPADWRFGVRAAQRIVQLELDVLRAVLMATSAESDAEAIFDARNELDHALNRLDGLHDDFMQAADIREALRGLQSDDGDTRSRSLADLTKQSRGYAQTTLEYLDAATTKFADSYRLLTEEAIQAAGLPPAETLVGNTDDPGRGVFLQCALAIEVIRRSFADEVDLDGAATLHVAQLTPLIRAPLFDTEGADAFAGRRRAQADPTLGPRTARDKLAGLRVNHFGGFYRASWRANDFMWGRLDGAAAAARLLIDAERARILASEQLKRPAELEPACQLARALLPSGEHAAGDDERRGMIWELLRPDPDSKQPDDDALREQLEGALRQDLGDTDRDAELTWAICTRALQYEVLREEAPYLVAETAADKEAGAFYANLDWQPNGSLQQPIDELRKGRDNHALPFRLGCDRADEATSTLALRTLSHAFLIALAAVGGALPLTKALSPVRMPLLSVQGSTAPRILDRLGVLLGFTGAAWYLSARWATIPADPPGDIPLKALWSPQTLALWVSILGVVGVAAVPIVRAGRTQYRDRRIWQAVVALALLATAGVIGLGLQWWKHGTIEALTTWNSTYRPPAELLWVVAAVGGFHVASMLDRVLRWARPLLRTVRNRVSYSAVLIGGTGLTLAIYVAKGALVPQLDNWGLETVICAVALGAPIVVAIELGAVSLFRLGKKQLDTAFAHRKAAEPTAAQAVTGQS